jgi:hypothetical protein
MECSKRRPDERSHFVAGCGTRRGASAFAPQQQTFCFRQPRSENCPLAEVRNGHRFISARSSPPTRRPREKTPKGCEAWSFQSTQAVCRAWKASSIKKSGLSRSLFAFIGKDATHHRRPYTSRTPGRSTPNAGCNRVLMRPRYHGADALLEHRRARRCRRASHRHRGRGRREAPRRRSGFQLLTRVTGPSPLQY